MNCVDHPAQLVEELNSKRIRCSLAKEAPEGKTEVTVHLPDFEDQRPPKEEKEPEPTGMDGAGAPSP